jgi:polyhydroxybutyrate depolymerase
LVKPNLLRNDGIEKEENSMRQIVFLTFMTLALMLTSASSIANDSLRNLFLERQKGRADALPSNDVQARITQPGDYRYTIRHDGLDRRYLVHVPPSYQPGKPLPLLVSMHGGGGSMEYQASDERYGQISKSDQEGFIVVFPNGVSPLSNGLLATFNAGTCCGPARDRNVDDVGFIRQIISNLKRQLDIDPDRVYATGMSNGGLMSYRLACEMSDTFRAIAPVAGTDNTLSCNPSKPVSVLHIHARNDDHVPFLGGRGSTKKQEAVTSFVSVPETISRWVARNGCPTTPKRVLDKPGATCDRYAPCRGGSVVELCVTTNGAHSWPGARKWRSKEPPSTSINANQVMWDFFKTL